MSGRRPSLMQPQTALILSLLLSHIDTHKEEITNRKQQLAYLEKKMIRKYILPYHSGTYGHTTHDENSLRTSLIATLRTQAKIDDFFKDGRAALSRDFVMAIEAAAKGAKVEIRGGYESEDGNEEGAEGSEDEENDPEEVERLREIAAREEDGDEDFDPDHARPAKRGKKSQARASRTTSPKYSVRNFYELDELDEDPDGLDVHEDEGGNYLDEVDGVDDDVDDVLESDDAESAGDPVNRIQAARRAQPSPESSKDSESQSSGTKRPSVEGERAEQALVPIRSEVTNDRNSAGHPERSPDDINSDNSKRSRKRKARSSARYLDDSDEEEEEQEAEEETPVPPPKTKKVRSHGEPQIVGLEASDVGADGPIEAAVVTAKLHALREKIRVKVESFFMNNRQDPSDNGEVVTTPSANLTPLYEAVFGTEDWKRAAVKAEEQNALLAGDLLQALVGRFLLQSVLQAPLPWSSPLDLTNQNTHGWRFVLPQLQQYGVNADDMLVHAARDQLEDDDFVRDVVRSRARSLASDLRLALSRHVEWLRFRGSSRASDDCDRDWHEDLFSDLQAICEEALLVRGYVSIVGWREEVRWSWYGAGERFQRGKMRNVDGASDGHYVALTIFPGFQVRERTGLNGMRTMIDCPATVVLVKRW